MSQRTSPEDARRGPSGTHRSGRRRRRVDFAAPPPRALTLSGWALLPLRAFLGVTFCFAGLQKLANPNFFNANSPSSIQAQLIASIRTSPIHELLGHLLGFAVPIGIVIALAELAVGLGTVLGLWTRWPQRGDGARGHALPHSELPLVAVLHGSRHRLRVRLDTARSRRVGRRTLR